MIMNRLLIGAALAVLTVPAFATDVRVTVNVGDPGYYGPIEVGGFPQPRLLYPQPLIVHPTPFRVAPRSRASDRAHGKLVGARGGITRNVPPAAAIVEQMVSEAEDTSRGLRALLACRRTREFDRCQEHGHRGLTAAPIRARYAGR